MMFSFIMFIQLFIAYTRNKTGMPYLFCRAELGEDPNDKKEVKEELSKSRKQVEQSRLRLTKLKQDGNELVTNIRVAGDSREAARRAEDDDAKRQRYSQIDEARSNSSMLDLLILLQIIQQYCNKHFSS